MISGKVSDLTIGVMPCCMLKGNGELSVFCLFIITITIVIGCFLVYRSRIEMYDLVSVDEFGTLICV